MTEITMKIESPELVVAINRLADVLIGTQKEITRLSPVAIAPEAPPATTQPEATPAVPVSPQPAVSVAPVAPQPVAPVTAPVTPPLAAVPTAAAPTYKVEQLCEAAGRLMDKGPEAVQQLQELLAKYQVGRVSNLPADQLGAFATDLRGLGVQI